MNEELYDTIQINPKEKPLSTHRAVKNVQKQQTNLALEQPPTRPPKNNRTLEVSTVNIFQTLDPSNVLK